MKRWFWLLLILLLPPASPAAAQEDAFAYLKWDTVITLEEDGSYLVEVTQAIRFDGRYTVGFLEIPREFTSQVEVQSVGDPDAEYTRLTAAETPGTYTVDTLPETVLVEWSFSPTTAGEIRTYTITYRVDGGLFVYPQERRLDWELLPADRSGLPVESASLTVRFPSDIDPDDIVTNVTGAEMEVGYGPREVSLSTTATIPNGQAVLPVIVFPPDLAPEAQPQRWQQRADEADLAFTVEAVDVDLTINASGTADVVEEQMVSVQSGALYSGFRVLSLRQMDAITNVSVAEGALPYVQEQDEACLNCFRVSFEPRLDNWVTYREATGELIFNPDSFGTVDLLWEFPPLVSGDSTTFQLQFQALGAIQVLEEEQRLTWTVIPPDNPPVPQAQVTLTLPPGITPDEVEIAGEEVVAEDGRLLIRHSGPVPSGEGWQIVVTLPAGATTASPPLWQQELETVLEEARAAQEQAAAAAAAEEARLARLRLGLLGATIALFIAGPLAVAALWYSRGRDPDPARLTPDVLSEPPSDLPPAVVNYLIEEEATGQGVLSALFHLASLGLLQVEMSQGSRLRFRRALDAELHEGETVETPAGETVPLPFHLVYLFNLLRDALPAGESRPLRAVSNALGPFLPQMYALLGNEADGFFAARPALVRRRWRNAGQWLVLGSVVLAVILAFLFFGEVGGIAVGPALAGIVSGILLLVVARFMPQRTDQGAEEAALWEAFGAYLRDLKERAGVTEAQRAADRHFPYAVALGVADVMFEQLRDLGGAPPVWTRPIAWEDVADRPGTPIPRPRRGEVTLPTLPRVGRDPSGGNSPRPVTRRARLPEQDEDAGGLDAWAEQLTGGLDNAGSELTNLLNSAVDASEESPFELVVRGAGAAARFSWKAGTTTARVAADVLSAMDSGGSGGYSGRSSSRSSWSGGSSRRSSSRSSSSRRSSGGRSGFR